MKGKNVKGYIGLFLGLAAILLILVSAFVPMTSLTGFGMNGKTNFFGNINIAIAWGGVILAIAAIVFGAMSKKDADKKGPRKPGVVIGIICLIIGLMCVAVISLFSTITEFINSNGQSGMIADIVKDNDDLRKQMDNVIKAIQKSAGVEETGITGSAAKAESSANDEAKASEASDNAAAEENDADSAEN